MADRRTIVLEALRTLGGRAKEIDLLRTINNGGHYLTPRALRMHLRGFGEQQVRCVDEKPVGTLLSVWEVVR